MDLPAIRTCFVADCAYNCDRACRALAITLEVDPAGARCDTFFPSPIHGGVKKATAGVGACGAEDCRYNAGARCTAVAISVGHRENHPGCLSYRPR